MLEEHELELEELRAAVAEGDDDLANGRYTDYTDETLPQLVEDIKREGRALREKRMKEAGLTR